MTLALMVSMRQVACGPQHRAEDLACHSQENVTAHTHANMRDS